MWFWHYAEPSQPQGLNITTVSSTQLNVLWSQPDYPNGIFLGYTLRFEASYPPDIESSGEELPGPDATYLLVVDLHPGTSYNIYLLARNDFGMSERVVGMGYTQPEGGLVVWLHYTECSSISLSMSLRSQLCAIVCSSNSLTISVSSSLVLHNPDGDLVSSFYYHMEGKNSKAAPTLWPGGVQ